jgi:hypothetical protein
VLFALWNKQKQDKKIQELLCKTGTVTDYSDRKFHCTAYEYAYWAKDTHMCRMLEQNMDEQTKEKMRIRCEAIERNGLKYTQNDKECCTTHFNLTPLKTALQEFIVVYNNWPNTGNLDARKAIWTAAWMKVGLAQRDVPVHVIYCRPERSFAPKPNFNEDKLQPVVTFFNVSIGYYADIRSWG